MTVSLGSFANVSQVAELQRQIDLLVVKGYPRLAGLSEHDFRARIAPLEEHLPDESFVLVVTQPLVEVAALIGLTSLAGKRGFTSMAPEDLARFRPTLDLAIPRSGAYLITDVDTGSAFLGVSPDDAEPAILALNRTPLTLEEGLALVTQHPQWLRERNCIEMLGSRAGDKRVTGIWVSKGSPRLGWCWAGNPHTWLGMATAARRLG